MKKPRFFYCAVKERIEQVQYMGHWYYCPGPHYRVKLVVTSELTSPHDD